jgi:dsRNA-gated channel SID-1
MGGALIVEGILSACYHICPTRVNFQFGALLNDVYPINIILLFIFSDTSFMYVIAALCTLKLYHARHADINVKSYMAYFVLAFIVLLGAGTPAHGEYYFKIAFTCFHLIACIALAVDVYYMGHCEFKFGKLLRFNSSFVCIHSFIL